MKRLLTMLMALLLVAGVYAQKKAAISIDSRTRYQHVTGFGGFSPSPQWSYWLGDTEMDKLFGKGDAQLGLTILRVYIANNRSFWGSGVANVKRAKRYGAYVFASPWSPPASWKSNGSDSNGGYLLESHWEDWANYLNDYQAYMKGQGAPIDAVSIQNEPDWNASYQSCIWTGEQMASFLKKYGSLIKCQIIAPEAIHFTRGMHEPILNDPDACAQLDILGGHFYGWDGSSYPLAAQKGKEVWMTEFLINERQQNSNININWKDDGFLFARNINDAMLANMSAWVHYSLKRYYGCLGDGTYGTTNNAITKRGYILSHYAKYVSNTTRIRHALTDETGKLTSSAYLSVTGDSVIAMVLNPGSETYSTTFTLPFNTVGGRQIVTTETTSMAKTALSWDEETSSPVLEVKPYSVNTFIFKKSSPREDLPEDDPSAQPIFADNFDLYGASCIPPGWRSQSDDGLRKAGAYSLGPRIMSFSVEGAMPYAFYFRAPTSGTGYVSYGEETAYPLYLTPGQYTLSYSLVGWKANQSVITQVLKGTKRIALSTVTSGSNVSANGSSVRITSTTDRELNFEVTEAGNYILKWQMAAASAGYKEMLLGNVKLVRHEATGIDRVVGVGSSDHANEPIYDIHGRCVTAPLRPGFYIVGGKKVIVR